MKITKKLNQIMALLGMLALGIILVQSCKKYDPKNYGTIKKYDNSKMVIASFQGIITDESGAPMKGVSVRTGTNTTQTDDQGAFYFRNISTPEHATTIHASKADFFNGNRTLTVKANQNHNVVLTLLHKGTPQNFVANNGGTVNFAGGLSYNFPANGIVNKATGAVYNGQVHVYSKKIDPTTNLGQRSMPGDLRGLTAANEEERLLQSFGMSVTEMYADDGSELQIAPNSQVTMTMDVPTSLLANAPSMLPLWYFDEVKEMWVEEGFATLQGNKYVGTIKHFSFWNCDTPAAANITIEMTLVDANGNPLNGYIVKLTNTANNDTRNGYTNTSGWVGGLCYSNATLTMTVFPPFGSGCSGVALLTQTVNTGSVNLNLGTIVVPNNTNSCTMTGSVVDCNNAILANAPVVISPLNIIVNTDASGNFSYTLPCTPSGTLTFSAYDIANSVYGTLSQSVVSGTNNLGTLTACGNISQYLTITLTNQTTGQVTNQTFTLPTQNGYVSVDSAMGSALSSIWANGTTQNEMVSLGVADSTVGTFPLSSFIAYLPPNINQTSWSVNAGSTVTYTSFPLFPGDVIGTFNVNVTASGTGDVYVGSGSFRLPRQ